METSKKKIRRYFDNKPDKPKHKSNSQDNVEVYNIKVGSKLRHKLNKDHLKNKSKYNKLDNNSRKSTKFPGKVPIDPRKLELHSRGERMAGTGVMHSFHREKLERREKKFNSAQTQAARAEILLAEEQGCLEVDEFTNTTSISQKTIADSIDIAAASKIFDLHLDFGPYRCKYSRNGRYLLLGGKKGHLASFDWVTKKLHCEINVMESIHDISWLHVETMMAVAQKEWLYIYDNNGIELHCLKKMDKILRMEFLPYHFLLAAVNEFGFMSWLDISIGEIVGHYNNHLGRTAVMTQNPYNATLCLGNSKGVVSLWSPNVKDSLATILCHKTPLTAIAVDSKGLYMATSGVDKSLKIWDIRNLDGPLQHYRLRSSPIDLDFSQKNMIAVGLDNVVEVYNDCCTKTAERPYLRHRMARTISNHVFCPYEDVLGVGTNKGFTSIIVPGSGEPNFDALENNPFQNKVQRREGEVKALLEKIPPELITLNPFEVTEVDVKTAQERIEARNKLRFLKPQNVDFTPRFKKGGKISRIARKKIIKEVAKKDFINQSIEANKILDLPKPTKKPTKSFGVLDRFVKK